MGKLNSIQLIGNLGSEVTMKHFDGGGCVGNVSMATTETYKNKQGEKVENTEWHRLVFRNKAAEIVEKYTEKGSPLWIEGRLKYRQWEKDGVKHTTAEIHVNNFEFLGSKKSTTKPEPAKPAEPAPLTPEQEDDLPF